MARSLPKRGEVVPLGAEAARADAWRIRTQSGKPKIRDSPARKSAWRILTRSVKPFRPKGRFVYMVAGLYVRGLGIFLIRIGSCI